MILSNRILCSVLFVVYFSKMTTQFIIEHETTEYRWTLTAIDTLFYSYFYQYFFDINLVNLKKNLLLLNLIVDILTLKLVVNVI